MLLGVRRVDEETDPRRLFAEARDQRGATDPRHSEVDERDVGLELLDHGAGLGAVLGGWQISGNYTYTDGDRLNVTLGRENNFDGFGPDRPDLVGSITYPKQENGDRTILWVDRAAFAAPPAPSAANPYPFGNVKRNAVRGPSRQFSNAAITKTFQLAPRVRFQLRADAANVFNHPNLSNPNLSLASADFGLIRTKDGNRRVIQVQGKLLF